MAISTLALCYNNYQVFEKEVKIRKGEAVALILASNNLSEVLRLFEYYCTVIAGDIPRGDPNETAMRDILQRILRKVKAHPKYLA